ncbi:very-short-patch-repair endonuclease [Allocatelliglobosispora scoriae]|uniref:Very-short-patch-repair endonuclease n=1 Tax=Allocatelliglobosispora scoriae TaxID=643052 RepID=A0A841BWX9_9ACTN|nr:hypothetical protein [Allocatelliglobosispora scoriae]MBB5872185.1 very-short-patch-repair endonuclease [Allocatelliglobosispora scoriae]
MGEMLSRLPAVVAGTAFRSEFYTWYGIQRSQFERAGLVHLAYDTWLFPDGSDFSHDDLIVTLLELASPYAALSHESAQRWYGVPVDGRYRDPRLHITSDPYEPAIQRQEFVTHVAGLSEYDVWRERDVRVTSPERLFLDIAGRCDREQLIVLGDALLRRGLTTIEAIQERLLTAQRVRGVRIAREIAPLLNGVAASPPESVLRLRFHDRRLPAPTPGAAVQVGGLVVHPDLPWPDYQVAVEYEGRQHAERAQFELDVNRYSALAAAGWLIIRASSQDLRDGSRTLIGRVSSALTSRGWTPPPPPPRRGRGRPPRNSR